MDRRKDIALASVVSALLCVTVFCDYLFWNKPYITDTDAGIVFAYRAAAAQAIRQTGEIPLWNPLAMTGVSWAAQDVQGGVFHTFDLFLLLFDDPVDGYMAGLIAHYFAALVAAFLVFRWAFRFDVAASVLATAIYAFNPEIHENLENLFTLGAFLGIPALILLAWMYVETGRYRFVLWAVVVTSICYYSSNILNLQVLPPLFVAFYIFFLYRRRGRIDWRAVWKTAVPYSFFTLCLCAPVILPSFQNALHAVRSRGTPPSVNFNILPSWVLGHIFPTFEYLTVRHFVESHWNRLHFLNKVLFRNGLPSISAYAYYSILALFCLVGYRRIRDRRALFLFAGFIGAVGAVGVVQGLPYISDLVYRTTGGHGFNRFLGPLMILGTAGLSGLVVCEVRRNRLRFEGAERVFSLGLVGLVSLAALGVVVVYAAALYALSFKDVLTGVVQVPEVQEILKERFAFGFKNIGVSLANLAWFFSPAWFYALLASAGIKILLLGAVAFYLLGRHTYRWALYAVIAVGILDAFANQRFMGGGNDLIRTHIYDPSSAEHALLSELDLSRRTAVFYPDEDLLQPKDFTNPRASFPHPSRYYPLMINFQMPYLVPSYSTYLSMMHKGQVKLHHDILAMGNNPSAYRWGGRVAWLNSEIYLYNPNSELVDYIGIDYIFSPVRLNRPKLRLLEKGRYYWIYENLQSRGRFDFVPYKEAETASEGIGYDISAEDGAGLRVLAADFNFNRVRVEVEVEEEGFLVLKDTFDEGWKGYVDGGERPVVLANGLFRGVLLSVGHHTVEFRFFPVWFFIGLGVCGLAIVGMVAVAVVERRAVQHSRRVYRMPPDVELPVLDGSDIPSKDVEREAVVSD